MRRQGPIGEGTPVPQVGDGWLMEFSLDGEPLRAVVVSTDEDAHAVAQEYVNMGRQA